MRIKRTKEEYVEAAKCSHSIAEMLRFFNLKPCGGNYNTLHKIIEKYEIDISHFNGKGWNIGLKFNPKRQIKTDELLIENSHYSSYKLKNRLFREQIKKEKCECCGLTKWMGKKIPLELHHKNGITTDDRLENLEILCPNCHAQTYNYRGLNIKSASFPKGENNK